MWQIAWRQFTTLGVVILLFIYILPYPYNLVISCIFLHLLELNFDEDEEEELLDMFAFDDLETEMPLFQKDFDATNAGIFWSKLCITNTIIPNQVILCYKKHIFYNYSIKKYLLALGDLKDIDIFFYSYSKYYKEKYLHPLKKYLAILQNPDIFLYRHSNSYKNIYLKDEIIKKKKIKKNIYISFRLFNFSKCNQFNVLLNKEIFNYYYYYLIYNLRHSSECHTLLLQNQALQQKYLKPLLKKTKLYNIYWLQYLFLYNLVKMSFLDDSKKAYYLEEKKKFEELPFYQDIVEHNYSDLCGLAGSKADRRKYTFFLEYLYLTDDNKYFPWSYFEEKLSQDFDLNPIEEQKLPKNFYQYFVYKVPKIYDRGTLAATDWEPFLSYHISDEIVPAFPLNHNLDKYSYFDFNYFCKYTNSLITYKSRKSYSYYFNNPIECLSPFSDYAMTQKGLFKFKFNIKNHYNQ